MKLFEIFGLNWKIFLAQLLSFAIFFYVLHKFGIKPIMKFLEERKQKVAKGLEYAEKTKITLEQASQKKQEIIKSARLEANKIIEQARNQAQTQEKEILNQTAQEVNQIKKEKINEIKEEKQQLIENAKSNFSDLIRQSLKKILKNKINIKLNKKYIESTLKNS